MCIYIYIYILFNCSSGPPGFANAGGVAAAALPAAPPPSFNKCLHFSICACHPCAGAMLILSVPFQF